MATRESVCTRQPVKLMIRPHAFYFGAAKYREGLKKTDGSVSKNNETLRGSQKNLKNQSWQVFRRTGV